MLIAVSRARTSTLFYDLITCLCDRARNVKSASVCEGKRVVARLRLPRIVELCNRHAPAAECGEYLLMARMIPPSQQVSPPVTDNKVKHGPFLRQKCSCCLDTDNKLSIIVITHKGEEFDNVENKKDETWLSVNLWCHYGYTGTVLFYYYY